MSHRKLTVITESDDIKNLFDSYLSNTDTDVPHDPTYIDRAIASFNKLLSFLIEYVNESMELIILKGAENTCPIGVDMEFYINFLNTFPFSDLDVGDIDLSLYVPVLQDVYGTVCYIGVDYDRFK